MPVQMMRVITAFGDILKFSSRRENILSGHPNIYNGINSLLMPVPM
jgi:hypothetical protein